MIQSGHWPTAAWSIVRPGRLPEKEDPVYAAIRQGKAKTGTAEELTRRIKEGAIA